MPTTRNKLVYNLANLIRGGVTSDDETVSLRQIGFWVDNTRNTLIRQDLNKNHSVSDNIKQSLGCIDVSRVDASTACGVQVDCDVFRTDIQIPKPIETYDRDLVTRIGPVALGSRPYLTIPLERVPYIGATPFLGLNESVKACILDRYIYLFMPKKNLVIKRINVIGVWAVPSDVKTFNNCEGLPCYSDDDNYPISDHMIETMTQMIMQTDLKIISQAPSDDLNDGKSDQQPNGTK